MPRRSLTNQRSELKPAPATARHSIASATFHRWSSQGSTVNASSAMKMPSRAQPSAIGAKAHDCASEVNWPKGSTSASLAAMAAPHGSP